MAKEWGCTSYKVSTEFIRTHQERKRKAKRAADGAGEARLCFDETLHGPWLGHATAAPGAKTGAIACRVLSSCLCNSPLDAAQSILLVRCYSTDIAQLMLPD
jgi:hypothetical protein